MDARCRRGLPETELFMDFMDACLDEEGNCTSSGPTLRLLLSSRLSGAARASRSTASVVGSDSGSPSEARNEPGAKRRNTTPDAVAKKEGMYSPPPQRRPTAAESHTEVAVVNPWISGVVTPPSLLFAGPFQMDAAPRNPTPEGIAALTRDESHPIVPSTKANIESMENTHEPRHTIAIVRTPAGRSARRRSKPMIDPIAMDMTMRQHMSASHLLRPRSSA
mmetsp:Transcript_6534/g.16443  ORF Transcript_6534/g.16443 Transcript_6534/m.16443 type:complete len:221 (+) Transcript_6534:136-798(+)